MARAASSRPFPYRRNAAHIALVAPTSENEFNTVKVALLPIGCWRLDDVRFGFGSSFVVPRACEELSHLGALITRLTETNNPTGYQKPPLSLFGHADPYDAVYGAHEVYGGSS